MFPVATTSGEHFNLTELFDICLRKDSDATAHFATTITNAGQEVAFLAEDGGRDSAKRTLACLLVWATPGPGLDEAVECLHDIHTNYVRLQNVPPAPTISALVGSIGQTIQRPKLEIVAE